MQAFPRAGQCIFFSLPETSLPQDCLEVLIGGADRFDIEILYQHIEYVRCNKGRQTGSKVDVFDAQMEER